MEFPWDTFETFPHPETGELLPEWAVSTVGGTTIEMSVNDRRIWRVLPREQWLVVLLAKRNQGKIDRAEQGTQRIITVLFGFGSPDDPIGNLMFVRLRFDLLALVKDPNGPAAQHLAKAMACIAKAWIDLGLKMDPDFYERTRLN